MSDEVVPGAGLTRRKALFAPWRLPFIKGPKEAHCFMCVAAELPEGDPDAWKAHLLLYRDDQAMVILNRYPYIGGHLLIAPLRHTADLAGLSSAESDALWTLTRRCVQVLTQVMEPQGCNLGMNLGKAAGAGVEDHLHMHVMPRWLGDTNFLPIIGQTQTVPVMLEELWNELYPVFQAKDEKRSENSEVRTAK
jgi:ATP adenylyltransferase